MRFVHLKSFSCQAIGLGFSSQFVVIRQVIALINRAAAEEPSPAAAGVLSPTAEVPSPAECTQETIRNISTATSTRVRDFLNSDFMKSTPFRT